jgi:CBS domain-containing protein
VPATAGITCTDSELLNRAKKGLFERTRLLSPESTLAAIQDLKLWIGEEFSFEEAASASFGRILSELWHSEYLDQLPPLLNKFERLASAYFIRRGSVTAFHGFCNAWREGILRRVLLFAEEGLELNDHGHPPTPYALLAAGSLGRREQTLEDCASYFLVWPEPGSAYFQQFAYRVMAILDQFGLLAKEGKGPLPELLWRGSLRDWEKFARGDGENRDSAYRLEVMADVRYVGGDENVGQEAVQIGRSHLKKWTSGCFFEFTKRAVATPVALTLFGGITVEKSGEQTGCINLARSGLQPLVSAVSVLAVQHDLEPGPTLDRLASLATLRVLEKGLVERLEVAYHQLASLKIEKEIALEQPYLNPTTLTVTEQQKLKRSLEAIRQLQRVIKKAQAKTSF